MCEVEEYIKNPEQYRFCEEYRLPTMIAYLRECDRKIFCPNCPKFRIYLRPVKMKPFPLGFDERNNRFFVNLPPIEV